MKKSTKTILILVGLIVALFLVNNIYEEIQYAKSRAEWKEKEAKEEAEKQAKWDTAKKLQEKFNKCLNSDDYPGAYAALDERIALLNGWSSESQELNRKALTNEIAYLISNADDKTSAKIIMAIKDRARYHAEYSQPVYAAEKEMLNFAVQVAKTNGNGDIAKQLQIALNSWEEENKE